MAGPLPANARLNLAEPGPDASTPLLLHFPSGLPPPSALANTPKEGGLKLRLRRNTKKNRTDQRELQAENETMRYHGANFGADGAAARSGGTLLIGVHHRGSDSVQLVPAAAFFQMRPSVKNPQLTLTPPETAADDDPAGRAAENYAQKRKLVASLGSAKAFKKQKQQDAAAVNADSVFNAASLSADIAGAAQAAADGAAPERSARELHPLHPPFDLEATTLAGAYPRGGLIPAHVWATLEYAILKDGSKSAEARVRMAQQPELWPPAVLAALAAPLPTEKSARHAHLRLLLYLAYMLRFASLRQPIKPARRGAQHSASSGACDHHPLAAQLLIPLGAWEQLLSDFTEAFVPEGAPPAALRAEGTQPVAMKRSITRTCREKLSLWALTLSLLIGEGKTPTAALAPTLGLTEPKCSFYLKQLGCKVDKVRALNSEEGERVGVASLPLPLTFPKLSRGGGRAR